MWHFDMFVTLKVFMLIGPSNDGRRHGRGTYLFLNYRTIDIEINIFLPNHRIVNRIVKFPLSYRLTLRYECTVRTGKLDLVHWVQARPHTCCTICMAWSLCARFTYTLYTGLINRSNMRFYSGQIMNCQWMIIRGVVVNNNSRPCLLCKSCFVY
jgi:hypothetical protein